MRIHNEKSWLQHTSKSNHLILFDARYSHSLIPLRILYHPDAVLEVVTLDDRQRGSGATNSSEYGLFPRSCSRSSMAGPSGEARSVDGDVESLGITEMDDHPTPAVRASLDNSQIHAERLEHLFLGMDGTMTLQEQLRQLRYQTQQMQGHMNEVQQKTLQTDQQFHNLQKKTLNTIERVQQQIDTVEQKTRQSDHQEYHQQTQLTIDQMQQRASEALQKMQQAMLQMQDAQRQMNQKTQTDKNPPAWVWVMFVCLAVFWYNNRETKDARY